MSEEQREAQVVNRGRTAIYALCGAGAVGMVAIAVARIAADTRQPPGWAIGAAGVLTAIFLAGVVAAIRYRIRAGRLLYVPAATLAVSFVVVVLSWSMVVAWLAPRAVVGRPVRRRRWSRRVLSVAPADHGLPTCRGAAAGWAATAAQEWAAVGSFHQLAVELAELDAPADLVARVLAAADDEVDHTRRCLRLAGPTAGVPALDVAVADGRWRTATLYRVAVESYVDGCVNEGAATLELALRAGDAGAGSEDLAVIAGDEAGHRILAWDVVTWAAATGGPVVDTAVRVVARRVAKAQVFGTGRSAWCMATARRDALEQLETLPSRRGVGP